MGNNNESLNDINSVEKKFNPLPSTILLIVLIIFCGYVLVLGLSNKDISGSNDTNNDVNNNINSTITLNQISDKFNSIEEVISYNENPEESISSKVESNKLIIDMFYNNVSHTFVYELNGNVLSIVIEEGYGLTVGSITGWLVDSIGQLHGLEAGETNKTFHSFELENYTINDGFEMNDSEVKIDISRPIKLLESNNYSADF